MARYLKQDSAPEQALQQVERLMDHLGIQIINYGAYGLLVQFESHPNKQYFIQSSESGERTMSFPRSTEDERLALYE